MKKTKNSRKNGKIREPEIFAIFREFYFFHTSLKVYIEKCTFLLCLLHLKTAENSFLNKCEKSYLWKELLLPLRNVAKNKRNILFCCRVLLQINHASLSSNISGSSKVSVLFRVCLCQLWSLKVSSGTSSIISIASKMLLFDDFLFGCGESFLCRVLLPEKKWHEFLLTQY